jgi:hypothetical protein
MTKLITAVFAVIFALSSSVVLATTATTTGGAAGAAANATNNAQAMDGSKMATQSMDNARQNQTGQNQPTPNNNPMAGQLPKQPVTNPQ